ncbi:hypothetical protein AGABI2DRAFT_142672 [Agaricus bisporus var. bisporus H97]|uniref:hypothetical protein n=1 Tax=Agaricus bisporus var. bisporus (strain H97 / ATCC MYA-4626 / FGSC 10389) TaxID=936046 RepID=UPI00029F525F|nr:hypothetical protein AGABI2DRAFT_142672 [Agaricus bisporus var. bisporus H97]EKV48579.1 hypothetical protein AGABI2DRAFT_142672 [Agaricus bisporus var. bisporus H97]
MTDLQPVACLFFRHPPSQELFTQIHDIPWLVLLPELEKLTTALETFLVTNPSSTAMDALLKARKAMESKMNPLRDAMLSARDFSRHYFEFVDNVFKNRVLSQYVKEVYTALAHETAKKAEEAQQALTEFREELEGGVFRVRSSVGGDDNTVSLFTTQSSQIVSTMVTAIEECNSLLQEFKETFLTITKQGFDPEAYEHNPPSDEECQLVSEKWQMFRKHLYGISLDWDLLAVHIQIPRFDVPACCDDTPDDARDAVALTSIPENPVNTEAPPNFPTSDITEISFWQNDHMIESSSAITGTATIPELQAAAWDRWYKLLGTRDSGSRFENLFEAPGDVFGQVFGKS